MAKPYRYRCSLRGHSMDVRAVSASYYPEDAIVTGSRDRTARIWTTEDRGTGYTESHCMGGPTNFVSSVCTLPPTEQYPCGLVIVGSNDCAIYVFSVDSPQPKYKLLGHSGTVCALASGKFGTVVSGSWDKTARVWLGQKCMMTLEGHQAAVWAVHILPAQGLTLTGSADKTIRMWRAGKCEKVFTGHEDCVRGLASNSTMEFLSCSNDATIRLWKVTGECLKIFQGHTNFIYGIAIVPDSDEFVSCGEDRTVRVWTLDSQNEDGCLQVIPLPAQSVWAVACLQNGDIVAGSSDGTARVFSSEPLRQASPDELNEFEEETAKNSLPAGELGDMKMSDLPGKEALYEPGKRDGQTKLVRDGTTVTCHQWSASDGRWLKIGDVMGASGSTQQSSGKSLYEGEEYDYVFSVDLDGEKSLKLPYNVSEDPWLAAQKFIHKNDLSQYYLEQIANFIINNIKGVTIGEVPPPEGFDPLTGGSRYVPGGSASVNQSPNAISEGTDPFTGGGRYVPTYSQTTNRIADNRNQEIESTKEIGNSYFPQKTFLKFEAAPNPAGLISKLREFNQEVQADQRMSKEEIDELLKLTILENTQPSDFQITLLVKALHWPSNLVFPALDVLRLSLRSTESNARIIHLGGSDLVKLIVGFLGANNAMAANQMLSLRALCNLFVHPLGQKTLATEGDSVLGAAMVCAGTSNKNIQIALATLLLNYAVLLSAQNVAIEGKSQCLSGAATVLQKLTDYEANFRILVCFGTLLWGDPEAIAFARTLDVLPILERLSDTSDPAKVGQCAVYLATLLK